MLSDSLRIESAVLALTIDLDDIDAIEQSKLDALEEAERRKKIHRMRRHVD